MRRIYLELPLLCADSRPKLLGQDVCGNASGRRLHLRPAEFLVAEVAIQVVGPAAPLRTPPTIRV